MNNTTLDPIVIKPVGFDVKAAWGECHKSVEDQGGLTYEDGEVNWGAAFSADPGLCSCPNCDQSYWQWGDVIKCSECEFVFPTNWWAIFSNGFHDGKRKRVDAHTSIHRRNPYYAQAYDMDHGAQDAWNAKRSIDWKSVVGDCDHVGDPMGLLKICQTCGKTKTGRRERSTAACVECEAKSKCRHYHPSAPLSHDGCKLGINLDVLIGSERSGWGCRIPCRLTSFSEEVIPCSKFEPYTVAEIEADDAEMDLAFGNFLVAGELINKVKEDHKGTDWSGVLECPVCDGKLSLSHAKCNGHVWGKCETEGCLAWME